MERIEATVYGRPVAKPRPRFSIVGTKVRTYTPGKAATWEQEVGYIVRAEALLQGHELPITGMVRLTIDAVMPRPKDKSRKADPEGLILRATRPDLDNVMKSVCDGLMKGGVIVDDAQVVELNGRSLYSEKGGEGRTIMTLEVLGIGAQGHPLTGQDFHDAVYGFGPLADEWQDKPHRVLIEAANMIKKLEKS